MSWRIHKQILEITDIQTLELPLKTELLSVGVQGDNLCLWYRCNPLTANKYKQAIAIVGTGHNCKYSKDKFIGTAQVGPFVWHVYDAS